MLFLREDTASQELMIGPFVDSTDGVTAETGLTINNTDIRLWKEGGTAFANKNSGGGTHEEDGYYEIVLDATDTNTAGKLIGNVTVAGALPVRFEAMVLPTKVYDSIVLGTDNLETDTVQWLGTAAATPTTAGVPEVDVTHVDGTANANQQAGRFDVNVERITNNSDAAGALSATFSGIINFNNLDSATSTTITDATSLSGYGDDALIGQTVFIKGGTGNGQSGIITDYDSTAGTITVAEAFAVTPDTTSDIIIFPWGGRADVRYWRGAAVSVPSISGVPEVDIVNVDGFAVRDDGDGRLETSVGKMSALTLTEPSGMFAWTGSAEDLLNVLAALVRNEINVDSDSMDVRNDADSANLWSYALSDAAGTFEHGEGA